MGDASGGGFGGGFNAPAPAGGGLFGSPPARKSLWFDMHNTFALCSFYFATRTHCTLRYPSQTIVTCTAAFGAAPSPGAFGAPALAPFGAPGMPLFPFLCFLMVVRKQI